MSRQKTTKRDREEGGGGGEWGGRWGGGGGAEKSYLLMIIFRSGKSLVLPTTQRLSHPKLLSDWSPKDNSR